MTHPYQPNLYYNFHRIHRTSIQLLLVQQLQCLVYHRHLPSSSSYLSALVSSFSFWLFHPLLPKVFKELLIRVSTEAQHQIFHRISLDLLVASYRFLACIIESILFFHKALHLQCLLSKSLKFNQQDLPFHFHNLLSSLVKLPFYPFEFLLIFQEGRLSFPNLSLVWEPCLKTQAHPASFLQLVFKLRFLKELFEFS